jgi:hypothetical protein
MAERRQEPDVPPGLPDSLSDSRGLHRTLGLGEVTAGGVGIIIGAGIYVLIGVAPSLRHSGGPGVAGMARRRPPCDAHADPRDRRVPAAIRRQISKRVRAPNPIRKLPGTS